MPQAVYPIETASPHSLLINKRSPGVPTVSERSTSPVSRINHSRIDSNALIASLKESAALLPAGGHNVSSSLTDSVENISERYAEVKKPEV